jgi:DNA-binding winged helix-turn-helix (wHTH) protein
MASSHHDSQAASMMLGALRIDLDAGIVYGTHGPSGLKPRAEALLILLCHNANALVTREQILDTVWAGRVVEDSVISNTISQIRKALGEEAKDAIETRARRGYMLVLRELYPAEPAGETPTAGIASVPMAAQADMRSPQDQSQIEAQAQPQSRPTDVDIPSRPRHRFVLALIALALLVLASLGVRALLLRPEGSDASLVLRPDVEMTISVIAAKKFDWLRNAVLREAVEQAYLRDANVVQVSGLLRRSAFLGPHLQVVIEADDAGRVSARMQLLHLNGEFSRRFHGPESRLPFELRQFLDQHLPPPNRPFTPALEAYAAGKVAEFEYDDQGAIANYQRAIARDPAMARAKIELAQRHMSQGRLNHTLRIVLELLAKNDLNPYVRCRAETMLADLAPERLSGTSCWTAEALRGLSTLQTRERLAHIGDRQPSALGPNDWFADRYFVIHAHIDQSQLPQARSEIARAKSIANAIGWESAQIQFDMALVEIAYYEDNSEKAGALLNKAAQHALKMGDLDASLNYRVQAIDTKVQAPGAGFDAKRRELANIAIRANERGAVFAEIGARHTLLRYLEDDPNAWASELSKLQALIDASFTHNLRINRSLQVMDEVRAQRAYARTLQGVAKIEAIGSLVPFNQAWSLALRMESQFARDELDAAIDTVAQMEKGSFNLEDATNPCLLAWLFVEAGREDRARFFIRKCGDKNLGRQRQATRGDYGLLARARMQQLGDRPIQAWPILRPRIQALLALPDRSRFETEMMTVLARHATGMPGADVTLLQRTLREAQAISRQKGAGPGIRFGVHVLAWRLCALRGGECGSVLPVWAQEDRLEARLAMQMRSSPRN